MISLQSAESGYGILSIKTNATPVTEVPKSNIVVELNSAAHNVKHENVFETKRQERHTAPWTDHLKVDHLKNFFEQQMGAREIVNSDTTADIVRQFCSELSDQEADIPFYILNLSHFARQYSQWNQYLSRIRPFYAVKSNPSGCIIRVLNELGAGFDCASAEELDLVRDHCGVSFDYAASVIYAHPCKPVSHIRRFRNAGVQMTVVDNTDELRKLKVYWPEAKILLRLRPDDTHSLNPLSSKFGAEEDDCIKILHLGRELNLQLIGCTFHVGSRCHDAQIFAEAIKMSRRIFDIACSDKFGFKFDVLDIGGGFSGHHTEELSFPKVSNVISNVLNTLFPEQEGVHLMSEPGRYFSSDGMILVCRIIGRRIASRSLVDQDNTLAALHLFQDSVDGSDNEAHSSKPEDGDVTRKVCDDLPLPMLVPSPASVCTERADMKGYKLMLTTDNKNIYYINDGIYGTFNAIVFDQKVFDLNYLRLATEIETNETFKSEGGEEHFKSIIFGPTCDSLDCIAHAIDLPLLNINDILWFPNVGSYTCSSASGFNGFKTNKYVLVWNR